jgi:hypothetical protein
LENHVNRQPKMGAWVLINAGWYKGIIKEGNTVSDSSPEAQKR